MTIAEIHGKISGTGTNLSDRMEDLLTADIFGAMRYIQANKALLPFLSTAQSYKGKDFKVEEEIIKVHYSFWPRLALPGCTPCEPDVMLGLEMAGERIHLVEVEAKYFSDLSSAEDESLQPNDQLVRELDNLCAIKSCDVLGWKSQLNIVDRTLLFVTQDMGMPRNLLSESLAEYSKKRKREDDIFWTSWRFLPSMLKQNIEKEKVVENRVVLEDMLDLLLRKELIMFQGIKPVTEYFTMPQFYQTTERKYLWPDNFQFSENFSKYTYKMVING